MKLNYFALFSGVLAALPVCFTRAQTAATPASAPSRPSEVVELSPFVVNTDQDVGYLAGNTLAGSRLNTALKDTPAAISVFTSEFLSDIGAFDIKEALAYAVNVEFDLDDDRSAINGNATIGSYQTYRVRGLPASTARNYFRWSIPTESALLDRIEDSRGPNSVLFGLASPGGLINSMTKQAQGARAFNRASFTLMSYDSYRGTLDLNRPMLGGKLAVRVNVVYNKTNSFRHWQFQESRIAHVAAKYDLTKQTHIRAEFERGEVDSNQPRNQNLINSVLLWNASGRPTFTAQAANAAVGVDRIAANVAVPRVTYIASNNMTIAMRGTMSTTSAGPFGTGPIMDTSISDYSINIGGPAQDRFSHYGAFSAFLEHRFSKTTFLEGGYNHQNHTFDRFDPRTDTPQRLKGDPNRTLNTGAPNPYAGQLYLEGGWMRLLADDQSDTGRLMLSTERDAGKWGNYRLAGLGEYEKSFDGGAVYHENWVDAVTGAPAFNPVPENAQNRVSRRNYPVERDWATYSISGPGRDGLLQNVHDPITGRTLSSKWIIANNNNPAETYSTQKSAMFAGQARYFRNRLIVAAGFRRDELSTYNVGTRRDPVTGEFIVARNDAQAEQRLSRTKNIGETKTLGLVYHVKPWLSLFYNQSDNLSVPDDGFRLPDSGEPGNPIPLESPRGKTEDYGFALTLLEGRLYARATYYSTQAEDQSTTSPSPVRDANNRIIDGLFDAGRINQAEVDRRTNVGGQGIFDFATEGIEFQVTANATKNWRFQLNYAHTNAVEENLFNEWKNWHALNVQYLSQFDIRNIRTSANRTIEEEIEFYQSTNNGLNQYVLNDGGTKLGNRKHKASVFTRYNFDSGPLRGLYIGGGYRYQSKMYTGLESEQNRREVWAPALGEADVMAGYSVRGLTKNRRLSFQVNVMNVFNERDPIVTRYSFATGQRLVLGMKPRDPLTWRFTTNFDF
jgi:iron complex outermembrane recepter protein